MICKIKMNNKDIHYVNFENYDNVCEIANKMGLLNCKYLCVNDNVAININNIPSIEKKE